MLRAVTRNHYDAIESDEVAKRSLWPRLLLSSPRELLLGIVGLGVGGAICVNALFLQPGPHPAPIFAVRPAAAAAIPHAPVPTNIVAREATGAVTLLPRPRPAEAGAAKPALPGRQSSAIGAGVKTDPIGDLLTRVASVEPARYSPPPPPMTSPATALPPVAAKPASAVAATGPSIESVQRALRDFGYGQIKVSGTYDAETRAAVEQFERQRGLPATGQLGERTLRELDKVAGPLS